MSYIKKLISFGFAIGALASLPSTSTAAIFGLDDRSLITPYSSDYGLSRSTAVGVLNSLIEEPAPGRFELLTESLEGTLCQDEKFAAQPSLPYACSGFLVGPDLLVTAGHCSVNTGSVKNESSMYCEAYSSWVFDYTADQSGKINLNQIPKENHYHCKQIIYAVSDSKNDFALIQLDRPVKNRTPLKLSASTLRGEEKLKMLGHPLGFPTVLSKNAKIFSNDLSKESILTSLDAFEGNSGSAVFNEKNEVIGLLISGSPSASWVLDKKNKCSRYNTCNEKGVNCLQHDYLNDGTVIKDMGSDVQRIEPVIKAILDFEKSRASK